MAAQYIIGTSILQAGVFFLLHVHYTANLEKAVLCKPLTASVQTIRGAIIHLFTLAHHIE